MYPISVWKDMMRPHVYTSDQAVRILRQLNAANRLRSRLRTDRSLYSTDPAAERLQLDRYSKFPAQISAGMLAVASAQPSLAGLVGISRKTRFPTFTPMIGGRILFVLNPEIPECGCASLPNADFFGPDGTLKLKAMVLAYNDNRQDAVELSLVMSLNPKMNKEFEDPDDPYAPTRTGIESGIAIYSVRNTGDALGLYSLPKTRNDAYLAECLGLSRGPRTCHRSGVAAYDKVFPVSNATEYFQDIPERLQQYLTDVADRLQSHNH